MLYIGHHKYKREVESGLNHSFMINESKVELLESPITHLIKINGD